MGSHLKKAGEGKAFGIASIEPDRRTNEHGYRLDYFERLLYFIEDYIPKLIKTSEKYEALQTLAIKHFPERSYIVTPAEMMKLIEKGAVALNN